MKKDLKKFKLTPENCVVIGSGILQALGIRKNKDIDVVVKEDTYNTLKKTNQFDIKENHGREVLDNGLFEIGTEWFVLEKSYKYDDLLKVSEIINGVRYINLDFLLRVKKSWVNSKTSRQKDVKDIELIEKYIKRQG